MGNNENAIETLTKARSFAKKDGSIDYTLAQAYQAIQQPAKALEIIQRLIKNDMNNSNLFQQQDNIHQFHKCYILSFQELGDPKF